MPRAGGTSASGVLTREGRMCTSKCTGTWQLQFTDTGLILKCFIVVQDAHGPAASAKTGKRKGKRKRSSNSGSPPELHNVPPATVRPLYQVSLREADHDSSIKILRMRHARLFLTCCLCVREEGR